MGRSKDGDVVFSTRGDNVCPRCGALPSACRCARGDGAARAPAQGGATQVGAAVRVGRETAGRKGAGVTVVSGLPLSPEQLTALAKEWKRSLGTGGTVRADGGIELAGEHRDKLMADLERRGYRPKRAGG